MRFGRLLPIQSLTIPIVLDGRNAIIVSSTASGKTESVIAPISEILLKKTMEGLSTLYVTPTRALANDIHERLSEQLSELDLTVSIKTGDKPKFNSEKPSDILITTPESLDSLICRYPDSLTNIKFVIIDEIHSIDGTYRGDQLRILLKRLKLIASDFSTYALSATVHSPEEVGRRYMDEFEIVQSESSRQIVEYYVSSFEEIHEISKKEKIKKTLVFCNSRQKTESIGMLVNQIWGPGKVVIHHGSLSKTEREETELFMKTCRRAICVSTMTLEIGIDIGDVDAVVLADIPWDNASFVQRIGRSGRRSGIIRVFLLCDSSSRHLFEEMMDSARSNHIDEKLYHVDLSVVVQQIFSVLFANPTGVRENYFDDLFSNFCSDNELWSILSYLLENEHVIRRNSKIYATENTMNMGERGSVHSNIPNTQSFEVVNLLTNKKIGGIQLSSNNLKGNDTFVLSGKSWQIVKTKKNKVFVKPSPKSSSPASFTVSSQFGAFFEYLPTELQ